MPAASFPNLPLKTITLVGGGTADWMTAALLSQLFVSGEVRITPSSSQGMPASLMLVA